MTIWSAMRATSVSRDTRPTSPLPPFSGRTGPRHVEASRSEVVRQRIEVDVLDGEPDRLGAAGGGAQDGLGSGEQLVEGPEGVHRLLAIAGPHQQGIAGFAGPRCGRGQGGPWRC